MNNVVQLKAPATPATGSADMRVRFETWAGTQFSPIERETFFARSKGGEYVRPSMRMAWYAWQAAIADLIALYQATPK